MAFLNRIDAEIVFNAPDIAEKTAWGYYLGYFRKGTDETMQNNCIIIEMREIGNTTTRKYAQGENASHRCTWSERANYEYKFPLKNI